MREKHYARRNGRSVDTFFWAARHCIRRRIYCNRWRGRSWSHREDRWSWSPFRLPAEDWATGCRSLWHSLRIRGWTRGCWWLPDSLFVWRRRWPKLGSTEILAVWAPEQFWFLQCGKDSKSTQSSACSYISKETETPNVTHTSCTTLYPVTFCWKSNISGACQNLLSVCNEPKEHTFALLKNKGSWERCTIIRAKDNCLGLLGRSSPASHCIYWDDLNLAELKIISETNQLDRDVRGVILTLSPSLCRPQVGSSPELNLSVFPYAWRPARFV